MSKPVNTYTILIQPSASESWQPLVTDLTRSAAVSAVRYWVYRAVAHCYSHADTAMSEMAPWWRAGYLRGNEINPKISFTDWLNQKPYQVAVLQHRSDPSAADKTTQKVIELWLVGPRLYEHDDLTMYGWQGLQLIPEKIFSEGYDTWLCLSQCKTSVVRRKVDQSNAVSYGKRWKILVTDHVQDIITGAQHVRQLAFI